MQNHEWYSDTFASGYKFDIFPVSRDTSHNADLGSQAKCGARTLACPTEDRK